MSSQELHATSYAILGMLSLRGPSTAYELKQAMGHIAREFWAVGHTQHYAETARLERLGLLRSTQEPDGRRRRVYEVTDAGGEALRGWLKAPTLQSLELRDVALLKLFLGELAEPQDTLALARLQIELYRDRLAELDALGARFADQPERRFRMAVVPFGRGLYQGALDFWTQVADGEI